MDRPTTSRRSRHRKTGHYSNHWYLPLCGRSSRIRRRPQSFCDRRDLGTVFSNSRSRAFRKNLIVSHSVNRWQIPLDEFRTESVLKAEKNLVSLLDRSRWIEAYILGTHLDRRGSLCVADLLISFFKRISLQALPRQWTTQKVHEHVAERLQIVASRLLAPHMRVDRHVSCGAGQRFMLSIWYMLIRI